MLVITRRLNEVVKIGDNVTVMVTRIGRYTVRLGITAPKDIPIIRDDAGQREVATTIFGTLPIGERP